MEQASRFVDEQNAAITRLARSFYVFERAWQWNLIRSACVSYQFMKSGEIAVAQTLFKL
jgi:hypothetical protein